MVLGSAWAGREAWAAARRRSSTSLSHLPSTSARRALQVLTFSARSARINLHAIHRHRTSQFTAAALPAAAAFLVAVLHPAAAALLADNQEVAYPAYPAAAYPAYPAAAFPETQAAAACRGAAERAASAGSRAAVAACQGDRVAPAPKAVAAESREAVDRAAASAAAIRRGPPSAAAPATPESPAGRPPSTR